MDTCARCGADLGIGRFCVNCGHRIGDPVTVSEAVAARETAPLEVPAQDETPWDLTDDLLPYDSGSSVAFDDSPLKGKAWLGWVIGAALLVALVLVLLRVFGVGDTDGTGEPDAGRTDQGSGASDDSQSSGKPPKGVGKRFDAARGASFEVPSTAPATTDLDGQLVDYESANMHDSAPATAWRMAGDGTGSVVTITLAKPTVVSRVGLINGYAKKVRGVDWYPNNRRILTAQWTFDDGSTLKQTFAERPTMQRLKVPPVRTTRVTLKITAVTASGKGEFGRDYTAISEVSINGRRAG